jgi:hypothetical protein
MLLGCVDMTNGYTDEADHGCDYYQENRDNCGDFDTVDDQGDALFSANAMCCACNFNIGNPVSNGMSLSSFFGMFVKLDVY